MTARSRNRKVIVWIVIACAAVVSVALGYPRPVFDPVLGDGWQCSRMAFLTSCSRNDRKAPEALRKAAIGFRRV